MNVATAKLNKTFLAHPYGIALAALTAIAVAAYKLSQETTHARDSVDEFNESIEPTLKNIDSMQKQVDELAERIKELESLESAGTISIAQQDELDTLREENEELERKLRVERELAKLAGDDGLKQTNQSFGERVESSYKTATIYDGVGGSYETSAYIREDEELQAAIDKYYEMRDAIASLNDELDNDNIKEVEYAKRKEELEKIMDSARNRAAEMNKAVEIEADGYKNAQEAGSELNETEKQNLAILESAKSVYNSFLQDLQGTSSATKELGDSISELEDSINNSSLFADEKTSKSIDSYQSSIKSLEQSLESISSLSSGDIIDLMQEFSSFDWESYGVSGTKGVGDLDSALRDLVKSQKDSIVETLRLADASPELIETFEQIANSAIHATDGISSTTKELSSIATAYKTVQGALEDYATTGSMSISNVTAMLDLSDAYLSALVDENGQLVFNENTYRELIEARLDEAEAKATQQALNDIESINSESSAIEYLTNNNYSLSDSLYETANAYGSVELAARKARNAMGVTDNQKSAIDGIYKAYNARMAVITAARKSINDNVAQTLNPKTSSSSSNKKSGSEDTYKEVVDFFERRVKTINDANESLDKTIANVVGSYAKNGLVSGEILNSQEMFRNYSAAVAMYSQKAGEALAKLPSDVAAKVQSGSVSLTDYIGKGNEDVVKAIQEYEKWADKVTDCKQQLEELKATIRKLELDKFNNILDDFTEQFDLRQGANDLIEKQIALLKEAGEFVGESFYTTQIEQSQKQLDILEKEKDALLSQFKESISSGSIQKGTEEWLKMVESLNDVDGKILDCKKSIEEMDNAILELHTEIFDRIQKQFGNIFDEADNLIGILESDKVTNNGLWSDSALAQLGLLAEQLELGQYQVEQYNQEIELLNKAYEDGRYSATEYVDKLADLTDKQWDAVNATENVKDAIVNLNNTRVNEIIDGINEEISAYKDLTDAEISALDAEKELHDYEKSISEKTKNIASLERQIASMQNDDTAATIAKRLKLEEQLADAKSDLEESEYEHSIQAQKDALSKQYEDFESEKQKEIDGLNLSLENREKLIFDSLESVRKNSETIGQEIAQVAIEHGVTVSNALISAWNKGENAIASYGTVLSSKSSAFIGNVANVEQSVFELQLQANETADNIAYMFGTKADNLVNELVNSYMGEANLNAMTSSLHDNLVNTLSGGYNINSIVNALSSVEDGINRVAESATNAANEIGKLGLEYIRTNVSSNQMDPHFLYNNSANPYSLPDGYKTREELWKTIGAKYHYASGTRNAQPGLRVVDEKGAELKLRRITSGNYEFGNAGDQIFTKAATDNLFDWSKYNPSNFIKDKSQGISVNYGSLITVQGDVNNSNIRQIEAAVQQGIDRFSDKLNRDWRYGKK